MATTAIDLLSPVHRLTFEQYQRMGEVGIFEGGPRVELIDGVVVEMSPQGIPHRNAIGWLTRHLVPQLDPTLMLMPQLPAYLPSLASAPEPDAWVIAEEDVRLREATPLLVIEVAASSLPFDRITKARLYARAGVTDYWILNLAAEAVEVHRLPVADAFTERTVHGTGAMLEPLLVPGVRVDVGALLAFLAD